MDLNGLKGIVQDLTKSAEERALGKALKLYSKGELDKAIEVLKEAHTKSPENAAVSFDLGRFLTLANRGAEGAEAFRSILRRDPKAYQRVAEAIEEVHARHAQVGPLYDALVEHFIRQDDLKSALSAMEQMQPEEIRAAAGRHVTKWEGLRKSAPGAKVARLSLHSAYHLALGHEALREYDRAADIYRTVAKLSPEEVDRLLPRLEGLVAKDYQNSVLRVAVGDLLLRAGRLAEASRHFGLAIDTDARAAGPVSERIDAYLQEKGQNPELLLILVQARQAAGDTKGALAAMSTLVEAGAHLDQVISTLQPLTGAEKSGPARRLLAAALLRAGRAQQALDPLLQVAEEEGLKAIYEPLQALVAAAPESTRAHLLLADIHLAEGRAADAVECLRRARDLSPREAGVLVPKLVRVLEIDAASPDAHLFLADLEAAAGEVERAVVLLRHLVRQSPASAAPALERLMALLAKEGSRAPRAVLGAAEACLELRQFPEALAHLKAVEASNQEIAAEFLHDAALLAAAAPTLGAALAEIMRGLEPRSPLPQAVRFVRAEALFFGGDPGAAAILLREVLQGAPERAEEVRQALERFDRNDPRAAEARYLLATLYLDRHEHAAAMSELTRPGPSNGALLDRVLAKYEEILSKTPGDWTARAALVQALLLRGRHDRVITLGQETLKMRDDASTARISLAMGDALSEKGDSDAAAQRFYTAYRRDRALVDEVIGKLKHLIEVEGTHALGSLLLGKVLTAEGRTAEAVEAFRSARAADPYLRDTVLTELQNLVAACPSDPQAGLWTIALLLEKGDSQRAVQLVSAQIDAHPDLAPVLAGHLEQILKAAPDQPLALYEMGRALQRLALYPKSIASYMEAFRRDASLAPMLLKRLREIVEVAPDCAEAYLGACTIHAARGKGLAAAEMIQKAFERVPGAADRLLPRLEELWTQDRKNARLAMIFADTCRRAGRHAQSLTAYQEAAESDPTLLDAAFEGFQEIVKACPRAGEAYLARARAHATRLRLEAAVADLGEAARLEPRLLPAVIAVAEELRARHAESTACALLLADLYLGAGRSDDAARLLGEENRKGRAPAERVPILLRLWRILAARREERAARACLEEAERLAPDRRALLAQVHRVHLDILRAEAARLRRSLDGAPGKPQERETAVRLLLDLGDLEGAQALLDGAQRSDDAAAARMRAEIALRRGDFARATEILAKLGPSRALAFGAARAGDYALAIQTLEHLTKEQADQALQAHLARLYHDLVADDLMGASRRLQEETVLTFGEGAAA